MRRFFAYKNPCGAFEVSEERLLRTIAYNLISTEKEPMSRVIYTVEMWSQSWEYRTVQEDTVRESLLDKVMLRGEGDFVCKLRLAICCHSGINIVLRR